MAVELLDLELALKSVTFLNRRMDAAIFLVLFSDCVLYSFSFHCLETALATVFFTAAATHHG